MNIGAIAACQMACNTAVRNAQRMQKEYDETRERKRKQQDSDKNK